MFGRFFPPLARGGSKTSLMHNRFGAGGGQGGGGQDTGEPPGPGPLQPQVGHPLRDSSSFSPKCGERAGWQFSFFLGVLGLILLIRGQYV